MAKPKSERRGIELPPYDERLVGVERRPVVSQEPDTAWARDRRAYEREAVAQAVRGEKKTFASWTLSLEDGLAIFNAAPSNTWWVRVHDLEPILACWGLDAIPGLVRCGQSAPAETVPIARRIDSPRIAPMMAEALGRLAKQRSIAEQWLFEHPRAAAIGLVPPAVEGAKSAKIFARAGLVRLVEGGQGAVVREVIDAYGLTDELADLLANVEAPVVATKPQRVESDAEVREIEERLRRAVPSKTTYDLLDRLTRIDSDRALFAVADLSTKARSKPLRRRAVQALDAVRARRGLSSDDLAVRMVPTAGLDDPEITIAGTRHRLAASPALDPQLVDPEGRRLAQLPKGAPKETKARWALLTKELKTIAKSLRERLERRMVAGDAWTAESFRAHVIGHPLLVEIARGLLFTAGPEAFFRVAEDGTLADEHDGASELPASAEVRIVHPLDVDRATLARWSQRFAEYDLMQPFEQLGRAAFAVSLVDGRVAGLEDLRLQPAQALALERAGWERGHIDHGPTLQSMRCVLPGLIAEVWLTPGIGLSDPMGSGSQALRVEVRAEHDAPAPRSLSEVVRALRSS
ncbi:MAG: DUF4132 domain-containing protein [Deltaproteobacteria bacterium]|nr:DUF4132 domain-containing protein [Deltaproteobacteria bacterium]